MTTFIGFKFNGNFSVFSFSVDCAVTQSSYTFKNTPSALPQLEEQSWRALCSTGQLQFQDVSVRFISSEHKVPLAAPLHEVSTHTLGAILKGSGLL